MPRKRTSSVLEDDFFAELVEEDRKPAKKARKPSKPKKAGKDIGTCSLTKKDIGDYVKSASKLEKYEIPRTQFEMKMDLAFFRSFFAENEGLSKPLKITPPTFDDNTPVIVAELKHSEAGELLGVSKVKGGNRMVTTYMKAMCFVFFPGEGRCTVWVTI